LHETLQDEVVVVALVERGLQLVAHLGGRLAADVVAFEQDLAASAGTHHAMAEVFEAGVGIAGADQDQDDGGEDEGLEGTTCGASEGRFLPRSRRVTAAANGSE